MSRTSEIAERAKRTEFRLQKTFCTCTHVAVTHMGGRGKCFDVTCPCVKFRKSRPCQTCGQPKSRHFPKVEFARSVHCCGPGDRSHK